ncbi:MerR family transcriptional regulator [Gracilibacillus kekensis]|uniref:DNA-binding transcriptional regulator, MerR family n=1 Tax=Gracilibacillus kekensis TaxID=1027249 RepID=A0A1M7JCI5_9BACI|nr:MerR family transcriptional regulator [Gracilibacillus kekensis]SHM50628.1 DNA-binding transcriptional regulator, MerR family [Gracilibacillus kekensis]
MITDKKFWKIGELANLTGLTIRTLRYYDQIGLYSPSDYSSAGYRLYNESDILHLQQILALKNLGLPLNKIKSILSDDEYNPHEIVSLQIAQLKDNIRTQQMLLKELQNVSTLMMMEMPLTVMDFTNLLNMMRTRHKTYFSERRANMENYFDELENHLNHSHSLKHREEK